MGMDYNGGERIVPRSQANERATCMRYRQFWKRIGGRLAPVGRQQIPGNGSELLCRRFARFEGIGDEPKPTKKARSE
jgi:hypothetical protein